MTDDELIEFANEFREGILEGFDTGSTLFCYMVCAPLSTLLNLNGVRNQMVESNWSEDSELAQLVGCEFNHFWLLLEDGRILDPTLDQFNTYGYEYPPVYLGAPTEFHEFSSLHG